MTGGQGEDEGAYVMRRWGARAGRPVPVASAALVAVCLAVALPGQAWAVRADAPRTGAAGAAAAGAEAAGGYAFADGIERIRGTATTGGAPTLTRGRTYKDRIEGGAKLVYRLDLDARTNAYVSAVAVPDPGSEVGTFDSLKVSLQDRNGYDCGSNESRFGSAEFPRPIAAYAHRTMDRDSSSCQDAGRYYVVVERRGKDAAPGTWDLEIRHELEPRLRTEGPTAAPENWPSASPPTSPGEPRQRAGGAGFADATGLTEGEWTDRIEPGQSLFYRVPVDWGQQLFAGVDLASSSGGGFVISALDVTLFNPMQGVVTSANPVSYDGKQKSADLEPLPPVKYENRFDSDARFTNTRFAGWYYLRVSLSPKVAEEFGRKPYGLTVRIDVEGAPGADPGYAGPPGVFDVTETDRDAAADGRSGAEAADGTMKLVAAAGIGTGTVLVLGLGAWTVLARRRAARAGAPGETGPTRYGPPAAW
ncbi:hypothetical protein [Streptomyces lavendofoliae]|uniref:hypothetical protein n=1 Tax=Streptomyces lavendofoliae TaxID=67314 RepID=UPI001E3DAC1E|nr:hypothetical protein [Streptomyces lavendofoliae]